MKIRFIGANGGVTGSCTWLHHRPTNTQFLVDCGLFQGELQADWHNHQQFPFEPEEIQFVFLTHAHLDHCGRLPLLYQRGFRGKVICTAATARLAKIVLNDAAKISDGFSKDDVGLIEFDCQDDKQGFRWCHSFGFASDLLATFYRNSHILGSVSLEISWLRGEPDDNHRRQFRSVVFSGDIGCNTKTHAYQPLLKGRQQPHEDTDYMVVESTYGGRDRDLQYQDSVHRQQVLREAIRHTVLGKRGCLVIPAFAMHRVQEIMVDLYQILSEELGKSQDDGLLNNSYSGDESRPAKRIKVLCHSPMAQRVNAVYAEFLNCSKAGEPDERIYRNEAMVDALGLESEAAVDGVLTRLFSPQKGGRPIQVGNGHTIQQLGRGKTKRAGDDADIIIATAGMCDAGPIVDYLEQVAGDPANTILLTGYQPKRTTGALLQQLVDREKHLEPLEIAGIGTVRAEIRSIGGYYSGHADPAGVCEFIESTQFKKPPKPVTVFLNHGTLEAKHAMRKLIQQRPLQEGRRPVANVIVTDAEEKWFDTESNAFDSAQATIERLTRELAESRRR